MSDLLRGLATAAQSAVTGGLSSYEDAAKKGKQQYNREQSQRRTKTHTTKETADEYNKRKAHEMLGMEQNKKQKSVQNSAATKALMHEQALRSKPYLRKTNRG